MDDMAYGAARAAISEKDDEYFAAHGLADILGKVGAESGRGAILALVRRLAADDTHALLAPISAGLREAVSDDDEFARIASGVVEKMRPIPFQRPLADALELAGRDRPAEAAGAAARLVGLGAADFAAFMIGGAYGKAGPECDVLVERLFSSEDPREIAAALRALRVACAEHGSPDAGRIRAAVRRTLSHDDAEVQREAMVALLGLCRGRGDAAAEGMIESMVARHERARPVLAAHIWRDSPFDDERSLRYLGACMEHRCDRHVMHSAYGALTRMAERSPGGVAKLLVWMFNSGWYESAMAGAVLDKLGNGGYPDAVAAVLEAREHSRGDKFGERLESAVVRIARNAGRGKVAGMVLGAIDGRPARRGPCLRILSLLAHEDWRDGGGPELLEWIMSRLCARPAEAGGEEAGGGRVPERVPERVPDRVPERAEAPAIPA